MKVDVWLAKITGIFHIIGAVLLAFIVIVILLGVVSRFLRFGIIGLDELSAVLGVLMTFMGIAYVLREEKHIRIDILINLLNPRNRAISKGFNYVVMIIICGVMIWQGFRLAIFSYVQKFTSYLFGFPLYIIRIVVLVGMILFLAEVFCHITHTVRRKKGEWRNKEC